MIEENPIVEEIRRTREEMLAKHNGDLDSLVDELQRHSRDRGTEASSAVGSAFVQAHAASPSKKVG